MKKTLQKGKIGHDANKKSMKDNHREPTAIRGQELGFDQFWGLKYKLTKFRGLGENMKSFGALLGAKVIEIFGKIQYVTKILSR